MQLKCKYTMVFLRPETQAEYRDVSVLLQYNPWKPKQNISSTDFTLNSSLVLTIFLDEKHFAHKIY